VGAGQGGCRQRVGDEVRGRTRKVGDRAQLCGTGVPALDERPVRKDVVDHTDHAHPRHPEREPDRPGAVDDVCGPDEPLGLGVGRVVDTGLLDVVVDAALVGGVLRHRVVPVEVVLGHVEYGGRLAADR
jgi:hypothetical protein